MKTTKQNTEQSLLISHLTLRKTVGIIGISLPLALIAWTFLSGDCNRIQSSLSHYYYTPMRDYFVGTICSISLFLFAYKGPDKIDGILGNIAGTLGFIVAFFPTYVLPEEVSDCIPQAIDNNPFGIIHLACAGSFFIILACFALFLFTRSEETPTPKKRQRNILYRVCGILILFCLVLVSLYFSHHLFNDLIIQYNPIFILETIILWAFGLSWLVKGEFLLKDE